MNNKTNLFPVPEMSPDPRVHVFRRVFDAVGEYEGMEVDAYAVVTERYLVLLDTLLAPQDMASVMQMLQNEQTGRQLLVVNSHADWDHAWGNRYFTGEHAAPIIAHEHGFTRLQSTEAQTELTDFQNRYPLFQDVVLTPPTLTFTQTMTLRGGDLTLELFSAAGHHADHIAAWLPQLRLLLAFDAVESPFPILENAHSLGEMYLTLRYIISLQPQHVLCSHGKTTTLAVVERNLRYFQEIERRTHLLLQNHRPDASELEQAATLLQYPFTEAIAGTQGPIDQTFYSWAHDHNCRCVLQLCMG